MSFRVPEEIIDEIGKEAKTKMVSTNVLINQILQQYVIWDKYESRMRMFRIPEESLHYVLNLLNESQRNEAVCITFNSIRDWSLVSKKRFDIHTCLQVLEEYCRMVGISVEENVSEGRRSFVIRHHLGQSISLFIEELAKKIFWDLVKIKTDCQPTNTTVVIKLLSKLD